MFRMIATSIVGFISLYVVTYLAIFVRYKIFGYKTTKKERVQFSFYITIVALAIIFIEKFIENIL